MAGPIEHTDSFSKSPAHSTRSPRPSPHLACCPERPQEEPKEKAVVLKVDVIDYDQTRMKEKCGGNNRRCSAQVALTAAPAKCKEGTGEDQLRRNDREAHVQHALPALVVEALFERNNLRIPHPGRQANQPAKVAKEGWVIERPWRGLVKVPVGQWERVGEGEPVSVDLKVRRVVGRHQRQLEQRRKDESVPLPCLEHSLPCAPHLHAERYCEARAEDESGPTASTQVFPFLTRHYHSPISMGPRPTSTTAPAREEAVREGALAIPALAALRGAPHREPARRTPLC